MDGGGGYTTNVNVINATELYTSSEFYAMYFTIKKMLKKKSTYHQCSEVLQFTV